MPQSPVIGGNILGQLLEKNLPVATEVYNLRSFGGSEPEAYAAIAAAMELLYGKQLSQSELATTITDGEPDEYLDAIYFNPDGYVEVFDVKRSSSCRKADLDSFFKSVDENVMGPPADYSIFNPVLAKALKKLHALPANKKLIKIKIVRGAGTSPTPAFQAHKAQLETYENVVDVSFYSAEDLIRERFESESYTPEWTLEISPNEKRYSFEERQELVVRIGIEKLLELMEQCTSGGYDLFNKNVRQDTNNAYLSSGIVHTLENSPENLHKYHNGITLAATSISKDLRDIFTIASPQIINGAQTVNAVAKWALVARNRTQLKSAHIICRIYVADRDLTEKICETSNTQVKVDLADLRSRDDVQFALESFIESIPNRQYSYSRKRPFKRGNSDISLPEFTQWLYAAIHEKPADAKNKKRALFDATSSGLYLRIFKSPSINNAGSMILLCDTGLFVRQQIALERDRDRRSLLRSADLHIIAGIHKMGGATMRNYAKMSRLVVGYKQRALRRDPNVTDNKLFTKSDEAWEYFKARI